VFAEGPRREEANKAPLKTKNATERLEEIGNQTRRRETDAQRHDVEEMEKTGQGAEPVMRRSCLKPHMMNMNVDRLSPLPRATDRRDALAAAGNSSTVDSERSGYRSTLTVTLCKLLPQIM